MSDEYKNDIEIRIIAENKKGFLPLLLLGDEQESAIDKYLERGDLFALYDDGLKSVCVVTDEGNGVIEIQNIATDARHQKQGYASYLIEYVSEHYADRYEKIILGTGDVPGILSFYENRGFKETHRLADYFTTHYDHPIIDDGILLKDKVYLQKRLNMVVSLRPWRLADVPDLTAAINNKKVLDNLRDGIPFPYTEKDGTEFITATLAAVKDTQYSFAIVYGSKVIGSIAVFRKENVHHLTAELGYYIAEPYWNKGLMTDAVRQICAIVFGNTDIIRIFAEPYAFNTASCLVLEKAGFQYEGTLRQNAVKNGQSVDMKMYALIKEDWNGNNA
jgi:RimJ/RimL family protein N-acetyltransferase